MNEYIARDGTKYSFDQSEMTPLSRSLWADLNVARNAADKALAIATEGLAIIGKLQADCDAITRANHCYRVELEDAEVKIRELMDRLDRYELVK